MVVTTNGGYPLDRNLYQAVKGMAAAERVVAAGGTIVMAAACADGAAGGGAFARLLADGPVPTRWSPTDGPGRSTAGRPRSSAGCSGRAEVWLHTEG